VNLLHLLFCLYHNVRAKDEWTQIHLQDFKFIKDYNHAIHKGCAKLRFCEEKTHQKRTRLKRLFKVCFLLIGFYNTNTRPVTTSTMLTSYVIYSRLRSMMSLILRIITNVVLGLLLFLRSITMRRSLTFRMIIIQRKMVGLLGADAICIKIGSLQRQ
jgi:hypothetical protein